MFGKGIFIIVDNHMYSITCLINVLIGVYLQRVESILDNKNICY